MNDAVYNLKQSVRRCRGPCYRCSGLVQNDTNPPVCLVGLKRSRELKRYEPLMSFKIDEENYGKYLVEKLKNYSKNDPDPHDIKGTMKAILKTIKS